MKTNGSLFVTSAIFSAVAITVTLYFRTKASKERREEGKDDAEKNKTNESSKTDNGKSRSLDVPVAEIGGSNTKVDNADSTTSKKRILTRGSITIVHGSMTGTCAKFAKDLYKTLQETLPKTRSLQIGTTEEWDWWDELINDDNDEENNKNGKQIAPIVIFFLPTYTNGTWPPCATSLENAFQDLQNDWRIAKFPLKNKLEAAVFGMGSSEYHDDQGKLNMGKPAKETVRYLQKLGVKCISKIRIGDDAVGNHAQETFELWKKDFLNRLDKKSRTKKNDSNKSSSCCAEKEEESGGGCCKETPNGDCSKTSNIVEEDDYDSDDEPEAEVHEEEMVDIEDMGDAMLASEIARNSSEPQEMVTPSQAAALKKEGYKLIGTHSAVKLCRWTKHQLRGRGGCYKHTFYGITSYQCMEATPSLACANKCVFCWRHHKNPVGKEWRWKTDDPNFIVEEAVQKHVNMIKETKGIPGVQMDRWKEAHTVRHCALSLVGEPIMYPRIDELLADLHRRKISSFLVTNGQHPVAIESLRPVTQLYVSVDAPTEESLIAIDRPLFKDAWDRLRLSLSSLKEKGQRTVARLTVVKGWNSDEIEGYAKLIVLGKVSLVEIKGVTFCGKSDASNLNMSNSPWHHEVVELAEILKKELDRIRESSVDDVPPEYGLACEHKHSCSVLLARVDQFSEIDNVTGERKWKTWIDYDKFHELAMKNASDPTFHFSVEDYTAETPAWALFGSEEEGFDPTDKRHRKKLKHPKYTKFDERGVPTHDDDGNEISSEERKRLYKLMEDKIREIGAGSTVTELKGGAKEIMDASLMFRGLVVTK